MQVWSMLGYGLLIVAYLIGAIPFSVIVGKVFCKTDVREHGSGNPGTTNAFRVLGRKWGLLVFVLDITKGGLIVLLVRLNVFGADAELLHPLAYGFAAAVGHVVPVYLKFKGGKAVATGAGALTAYVPLLAIFGLLSYGIALKMSRYVSLASCTAAVTMLIGASVVFFIGPDGASESAWVTLFGARGDWVFVVLTAIGVVSILLRHIGNFKNIARGVEPKSEFLQK